MKKIINGKSYNTETAKKLAEWSPDIAVNDVDFYEEALYRKRTGEYFIYGQGGPGSKYAEQAYGGFIAGESILPQTLESTQAWAKRHLDADDYEKIFGPVSEGDSLGDLHVQIDGKLYGKLKQYASEHQLTVKEATEKALSNFLNA